MINTSEFISIENLTKTFHTNAGKVQAVNDVSFILRKGSIVGLVGESGSGKTTLGRCILRLIEPSSGSVNLEGTNLLKLNNSKLRAMRKRMQIIFQDPFSSLNPRMRVQDIIAEGIKVHDKLISKKDRLIRVAELMEEVGLQAEQMSRYPHEFSGGQRQRVGIARALAVNPEFIVADESVSALDVSVQAQILNLMLSLRDKHNLTILFIAHDLSVVEYLCDEVVVLYLGKIVESGNAKEVYSNPQHPYTRALLSAVPIPDPRANIDREILKGDMPSALSPPSGCVFRTRCKYADERCLETIPPTVNINDGHSAACLKLGELK
jgi:oligopeptide/dipeptide ABC transporter ATP-binding protein|tara:strand:+ start:5978 stop:6943 length:966 start_codon:yes stop_codon:yes gene_type:complete